MVRKNFGIFLLILFGISLFSGVIILTFGSKQFLRNQYLYHIGRTTLHDAVFVNYTDGRFFVAPLSVAETCEDPAWKDGQDVYPYILGSPDACVKLIGQGLNSSSINAYRQYDTRYYPYIQEPYKIVGDSIYIYRFCYDIEQFDMFFMARNGLWYSPRNDDSLDEFSYDKDYDIALRAHFSLWQIIKMRIEWYRSNSE